MRYIHTMEYHSTLKRKAILSRATAGMNLEGIMLSKMNQLQRGNTTQFHLFEESKAVKFIEMEGRVVTEGEGARGLFNGYTVSDLQDKSSADLFPNNVKNIQHY